MRLITVRSQIREVAKRWREQYPEGYGSGTRYRLNTEDVYAQLCALDLENVTFGVVNKIIGNDSWTKVPECDECGAESPPAVVEIGQPPDIESHTAHLCCSCARKAVRLFGVKP